MLAIGRILRTGARLLLLDEPTEGLAPVIIQQIGRTIGALKAQGFTILLVEQNFHFAATLADRHYVMEHGRIVDHFRPANWQPIRKNCTTISEFDNQVSSTAALLARPITREVSMLFPTRLVFAFAALLCGTAAASAQDVAVKIGVLNDMSGLYADIGGPGSVAAAKMAVEDFNPAAHRMKVEVVSGDHQNKPDVGANIARQWYDVDHVDVIVDVPTSSVALAVNEVTREKNKVFLGSGRASSDLTGPKCSPNTIQWTYDTWMLANGTGKAVVKTGGDTWFFLTADYAFGHALERDTSAVIVANGGKVLGHVLRAARHQRLLVVPAAGASLEGQDRRPCQCGRRHGQCDQAGRRIRHHGRRPAFRRPACFHQRHRSAWAEDRARPGADRDLVLGHDRCQSRLHQALAGRIVAAG